MTEPHAAVVAEELTKRYGETAVLDRFTWTVNRGEVAGLLGPNGAGKTTAVRILTTLLEADGGNARVAGYDVARQPTEVRRRIGLVGQHAALDEVLSGRQNLIMFGRLYRLGIKAARVRAEQLLKQFGLVDSADRPVSTYSGGMRRRLDLAAGLILDPPVLFLDEPTTGLDPRSRTEVWDAVRALVAGGTTVVLTTQYLEEADQLADRIAVIDRGRIVAEGSPEDLKGQLGGDRVDVVVHDVGRLPVAAELIADITGGEAEADPDTRRVSVPVTDRMASLASIMAALAEADVEIEDIAVRRPTLDEVFLHLTATHPEVAA
jgi:ABC-2 type transport system ATP-binding protein